MKKFSVAKKCGVFIFAAFLLFANLECGEIHQPIRNTIETQIKKQDDISRIYYPTGELQQGYIKDEILIDANSLEQAQEYAVTLNAVLVSYSNGLAVMQVPSADDSLIYAERLCLDLPPVGLNYVYEISENKEKVLSSPSDFSMQFFHQNMNNIKAWEITTGSLDVVVAVIDTGIDISHPKFEGRISEKSYNSHTDKQGIEYVEDDHNHGTHISGIIAAAQDDGREFSGVAPDVTIMAIKSNVPNDPRLIELASVIRGIRYAADNDVDIINISLGRSYQSGENPQEKAAIEYAVDKGIVVVCAAGNDSSEDVSYPAAYEESIAVSATDYQGRFDYSYSNYGSKLNIAAPGTNIYSTVINGYDSISGTSMASANATGVAALIKSKYPNFTVRQIKERLYSTVRDAGVLGFDYYYGHGIVDTYAALSGVQSYTANIGDINEDGVVNAKDVTRLRRYLARGWEDEGYIHEILADVNSNSVLDAKDVTRLRRYLAGGWENDNALG